MRTPEELDSPEFNDNMDDLVALLKAQGIPYTIEQHRGANPKILPILGYYPTGKWHVIIKDHYSVIRGMASWGLYELMNTGSTEWFPEPTRFNTPEELVEALRLNKIV